MLEHELHAIDPGEEGADEAGAGIPVVDRVPARSGPLVELRMRLEDEGPEPLGEPDHRFGVVGEELLDRGVPGHGRTVARG